MYSAVSLKKKKKVSAQKDSLRNLWAHDLFRERISKEIDHTKAQTICYDDFAILANLMRITGTFPFLKNHNGTVTSRFCSPLTLYSIVFTILMVAASYDTQARTVAWLCRQNFTFDQTSLFAAGVLLTLTDLLPLCTLLERNKTVNYLNSWGHFEKQYNELTGSKLTVKTRKIQIAVLLLQISFLLASFYMLNSTAFQSREAINGIPGYSFLTFTYQTTIVYNGCLMISYGSYWCLHLKAITQAADQLKARLEDRRKLYNIDDLFRLWGSLRSLCVNLGPSFWMTYLTFLTMLFMVLIVAAYTAFVAFMYESDFIIASFRISYVFFVFLYLSLIGGASYIAIISVGDNFKRSLLSMAANETNPVRKRKLQDFVVAISQNPPTISLNGFLTLNREFNVSLYSTIVSYMIVVIQFRLSS